MRNRHGRRAATEKEPAMNRQERRAHEAKHRHQLKRVRRPDYDPLRLQFTKAGTRSGRSARRCSLGALRLSTTAAVVCARSCSCASLRVSAKQSCELASCRLPALLHQSGLVRAKAAAQILGISSWRLTGIEDPHDRATISREAKRIAERLVDLNWEALQLLADRLNKAGKLDLADVVDFLRGRPLRSRRAGLARRKAAA